MDYQNRFEKEVTDIFVKEDTESVKTDSFEHHVNRMAEAYNKMKNSIEEKYAEQDYEPEYYVTESGKIEELTKEKELDMLNQAYENHSNFMATSTEIWSELQDFTPSVVYHKGSEQTANEQNIGENQENTAKSKAKNKGDEDKISQALQKIMQEDLTIKTVNDSANHQTLIYGIGEQQLEVLVETLKNKYKVEIELSRPKVAFRETIRGTSDVEYKYKKQSGGHGQYGHVKMRFSPSGNLEEAYEFSQEVVGGAVPKNFFPAVEKGLQEGVQKGPLAAYPVLGIKAVLYDGSYHAVDSSEMAFKVAAREALKKGILEAKPVLLEPIASLKITLPDVYTGDVMGDLNKKRARVLGMTPDNKGTTEILADIPYIELYGYGTRLRSMTQGSGDFSYQFARYEQAPEEVARVQMEERASKLASEEDK